MEWLVVYQNIDYIYSPLEKLKKNFISDSDSFMFACLKLYAERERLKVKKCLKTLLHFDMNSMLKEAAKRLF